MTCSPLTMNYIRTKRTRITAGPRHTSCESLPLFSVCISVDILAGRTRYLSQGMIITIRDRNQAQVSLPTDPSRRQVKLHTVSFDFRVRSATRGFLLHRRTHQEHSILARVKFWEVHLLLCSICLHLYMQANVTQTKHLFTQFFVTLLVQMTNIIKVLGRTP
jgi:hypothetical protein